MNNFIKGFSHALAGFSWIFRPKIRRFVYIPLAINVLLFTLAISLLGKYAGEWVTGLIGQKANWWHIFRWAYDLIVPVLSVVIYVALILVGYFSFSTVANLLAAPFNAQLAKAVEQRLAGQPITYSEMPLAKEVWVTVQSELAKIVRFALLAAVLLLLLVVPGINVFFPLVWFIFMAYTLSIQYIDYPMANHGHFYTAQRKLLKKHRAQRLGFGTAANVLLLIPFVNFLAMPVCVCGATVWWHSDLQENIHTK